MTTNNARKGIFPGDGYLQFGVFFQYANQLGHKPVLVIVPGYGFDQLQVAGFGHLGLGGVKDRTKVRADNIGRYDVIVGVAKRRIIFCRFLQGSIDFIDGDFLPRIETSSVTEPVFVGTR